MAYCEDGAGRIFGEPLKLPRMDDEEAFEDRDGCATKTRSRNEINQALAVTLTLSSKSPPSGLAKQGEPATIEATSRLLDLVTDITSKSRRNRHPRIRRLLYRSRLILIQR